MGRVIPDHWAADLATPSTLVWLLLVNAVAFLVGVEFYVDTLDEVPTILWPLYADSPTAIALATLALATLLPNLGRQPHQAPRNRPLAYLHTFAFVWLVKFGLWTFVALTLRPELYLFAAGALWDYWGIVITHFLFVAEAFLFPHAAATTPGALASALALLLANDVFDYVFGYHPPLEYEPGLVLPVISVGLSVFAVALAWWAFEPLSEWSATLES
ncbi:Uncharacterized membrane protein, DUF1405 family [Halalkaliarchaeum sp. AArc-CO]|uniref:DUF1405 domain-containing protein n=1 Tax=unclassified Halalkaliarchaeum TaxID=2678344 RepID=UPI00217EB16A|nr:MULTISPECIES: DUF1405 domain-containing protein [unclassified Halalkaliarchaeum]MDR5674110.1 DUF1405 domain-containing protein [Halalkaliarchaeum sp. AArc-GB]UWG50829.1 Uncharacterized membrane protein, DUF1405 family [Halalkaliarchaeum sp. AArc-CO]